MKAETVDQYIDQAPTEYQPMMRELREIIKEAAPEAEEKISYSMPYYGYHGRLVYFGFAKNHIGLYLPPPIVENHQDELTQYKTSKSAIQFPLGELLPAELITKLVKARMKMNEESAK
ncbi:MAG: iron chaperone [Weeksellaceae bacterium]